jgi:SAM-dependent methyltransferase
MSANSPATGTTGYDRIAYPGWVFPQSHPDRLATLATLFGMAPADPASCRVLELGCGDGANLVALAYAHPRAHFTGLDLAATAIERGRREAAALGLGNLDLRVADLLALPAGLGEFDYVIAHGVYSWVPAPVRDALLAAIRRHLAPQGVAFVSYNVYPGGHLRAMLREAVLMHLEEVEEPGERLRGAREFLRWLAAARQTGEGAAGGAMAAEAARLLKRTDAGLFHDDLGENFHLCHFRDFCEEAAGHDLQFLAEAELPAMGEGDLSASARERLAAFAPGLVEREQYLDFVRDRRFRQSLLCRSGISLASELRGEALRSLAVSAAAEPIDEPGRASPVRRFRGRGQAVIETADPLLQETLQGLAVAWPRAQPMAALHAGALARAGRRARPDDLARITDFLLAAYAAGNVQLHAGQAAFAAEPGEQPRASALARRQSTDGPEVVGLTGRTVHLDDPLSRQVLALLDGTRDRAMLGQALGVDAAALERVLEGLARCALLHED